MAESNNADRDTKMSKEKSAEWFSISWNPISGRCPHRCVDLDGKQYCYMWRPGGIADRFKKTHDHPLMLNEKILNHPPKSGRVLVGSSTDMFAEEVPNHWLSKVITRLNPKFYPSKALYFVLTKNPERYKHIDFPPENIWYGATWDGVNTAGNVIALQCDAGLNNKFISFEPLLADPRFIALDGIQWIIIGADSRKGKPRPPKEWADYLIAEARRFGAMVFVKDNYNYPEKIKEMPC
jgi:protein gp37